MSSAAETVAFTVRLSAEEHRRLRELAIDGHRSLAAQARMMLAEQLEAQVTASTEKAA